jgi:predicted dehydrogenase
VIGMVGAGAFARSELLPRLHHHLGCRLKILISERGISAEQTGRRYGFEAVSNTVEHLWQDKEINGVIIAAPHSLHAQLVCAALKAEKAVFVEKPLALDMAELEAVIKARQQSENAFLLVGFNRRFAPFAQDLQRRLSQHSGRKTLLIRVNAGTLEAQSWQRRPEEGGGRLVGELCHFVDLASFLIDKPIVALQASSATGNPGALSLANKHAAANGQADPCEDVSVTLEFADGSIATLLYTAQGDTAAGKELIEAYAGGASYQIDNFRSYKITQAGKSRTQRALTGQDKGHKGEIAAFIAALSPAEGAQLCPPVAEDALFLSSQASLYIPIALREGRRLSLLPQS